MGKEIHRQTHAGEKMSSSPECKICGDYIHHGDVVCSRCLPKALQSEREKVLDELKENLRDRFISSNNQWSKGRNSGLLECCNIIDELRAGEP